jgi:hypothetical protein
MSNDMPFDTYHDDDLADEALDERHGTKYTCGGSIACA